MNKEITQMTVKQLYQSLKMAIDEGYGDKYIILADDNEGNGFHGMFFGVTYRQNEVEQNIEWSNGIYDSQVKDPEKLVILG